MYTINEAIAQVSKAMLDKQVSPAAYDYIMAPYLETLPPDMRWKASLVIKQKAHEMSAKIILRGEGL